MTRRTLTALSLIALASIAGCSSSAKTESLGYANSVCPIMGSPVGPNAKTVDYKGERVAFCCPGCDAKWSALSDADKAAKLAKAR